VKLCFFVPIFFLSFIEYVMLMWEKIVGSPHFYVLQATKSWMGPRDGAILKTASGCNILAPWQSPSVMIIPTLYSTTYCKRKVTTAQLAY